MSSSMFVDFVMDGGMKSNCEKVDSMILHLSEPTLPFPSKFLCTECLQKIAKTGSLCCVAARPHGSNTASRDWSMGPHEPYWRTNTSFSPPPSRWDFHFQPDGLSHGSHDGIQTYGSSVSSNSKESSSWVRGNLLYNHQYSTSDGAGPFLSSPSDLSQGPQWTPPAIQEITLDDYETTTRRDQVAGKLPFASIVEGTPKNADSGVSSSSHSDCSESEPMFMSCLSSHRNFSSRRYFMSKPIHPLSFPMVTPTTEASDSGGTGFSDNAGTSQRDAHGRSSSSSSNDFADVSEPFEPDSFGRLCVPSDGFKCGLCERFLSQRSPWSSHRIVRNGDRPVAGVLSCQHVFHAECLEQTTPKTRKNDPPCPICVKLEEQNSPDNRVFSRFRNGFARLRPFSEDCPSRPWGCAQAGDCVEGALHAPSRSTTLLVNRSRMKKNLFMKSNSSKEFPGKLRQSGSSSSLLFGGKSIDQGAIGCSKTIAGPSVKW
ncbi:uncharacterized protein LOC111289069 [Durio zibethinus]|uniref:Uncharacterized protein LOC111289069 n=1 Tax=Durio zibethinus TaxID=66656 RepID=A0A6P5Y5H0_DURZI|nr:uncharacterized protein LOC111289069 [Durio zibethinus]